MPYDSTEVENELRSLSQEQRRVQEHIAAIQQQIRDDETWLTTHIPTSEEYQETLEEWLGLQTYAAELQSQATALDDALLELKEAQAQLTSTPITVT